MAGHSKWANIRFRKGAQDAKRGKIFTKLVREITQAAREGGPDLETNPKLRLATDKALKANMTKDSIQRAVAKGAGTQDGVDYMELVYEGYAPGGVAVMVTCLTDNKNRTVAEVRHAFSKHGGALGTDGSVAYMFNRTGVIEVETDMDEEQAFDQFIELGANDVEATEDGYKLEVSPGELHQIHQQIIELKHNIISAENTYLPEQVVNIESLEQAEKLIKFIDVLEDLDDVQNVYANYEIEQSLLEKLS
tara:strand:+ start:3573 stop:4319 length:747 start_codon:yes stop_codon:yes gene_type:complete